MTKSRAGEESFSIRLTLATEAAAAAAEARTDAPALAQTTDGF